MKKIPSVLASFVILALGLFLFFNGSTGEDSPTPKPAPSPVEATRKIDDNEQSESVIGDYSSVTQDEFDQLSQKQQGKMLENLFSTSGRKSWGWRKRTPKKIT